MPGDLNELINHATPFAPVNAEDVAGRLQKTTPSSRETPSTSPHPPGEPQRAVDPQRLMTTRVFVPISPQTQAGGEGVVAYELRELAQGSAGLAIYTSAEKLNQVLGAAQPHVEIEIIELLRQISGRVPVVVDPNLRASVD